MNLAALPRLSTWLLAGLLLVAPPLRAQDDDTWQSEIVFEGPDGTLQYVADDEGNRIPDFSHAGYRGGGVALPDVPTVKRIDPVDGNNYFHIQLALDELAAQAPGADGYRGALELGPGVYPVDRELRVSASGIVLRGVGDDEDPAENTIIRRTGTREESVLRIGGGSNNAWREVGGTQTDITTSFVPVGSRSFAVAEPEHFEVGDQVLITHPITEAWLDAIDGGGTANDPDLPRWGLDEFVITYTRTVTAIQDTLVEIDAPVFNHLDRSLVQSSMALRDRSGQVEEVGLEDLRIEIETNGPLSEDHARTAVQFVNVENGWVRGATALHFVYAGFDIRSSLHVTVRDSRALEPHSRIEGARRYNFAVGRSQLILFEGNVATEGRHAYVGNGEAWDSGIVFLDNLSVGAYTSSESHRHWGQGFLYDNHTEVGSPLRQRRIHLGNRGSYGTGHGWAGVHSVAWNCTMNGSAILIEKPPTAQNYSIGGEGFITGRGGPFDRVEGYIEGDNRSGLSPVSLYRKQLEDRLGVSVDTETERPPETGARLENYPNPFRNGTTIRYHVTRPVEVRLEIYDLLGRRVAVLVDSLQGAGTHERYFDAVDRPAGIYLVRLRTSSDDGTGAVHEKTLVRVR